MTERTKFLSRVENASEAGLVDVKFFFRPTRQMKPTDIFASLNEIEDAIKEGACVRHEGWNGDEAKLS